jgi:DNA segregation ATPase FtsK/SpoIIIE, S-DNA-T family
MLVLFLIVLAVAVLARPLIAVYRLTRMGHDARRHYWAALWAKIRWRWLARNLGLAYVDMHRRGSVLHLPGSTSVPLSDRGRDKLRYPRAKIRADEFGITAMVKTIPKVGRRQLEDQAEHIANAWRCHRAQVCQPRPGRVIVRGLRRDPLTLPFPASAAPPGVYGTTPVQAPGPGLRLYLGLDEWGVHRWIQLAGVTGITVGGLPGFGKTEFVKSVLCQLVPYPVRLVIIDGKGGGDYHDFRDWAWIYAEDELPAVAVALEETHSEMRTRLGSVLERTGHRNAWRAGPTPAFPILLTVIDECHTFFDLDAVKGHQADERFARTCRTLAGQLVRKGRSVLAVTLFLTQKQTGDAIPTFIRDNCRHGLSFAVKTKDAAVAALGEGIRDYPSYCPSGLQDPAYIGVATAALRTGHDPFVRLRVPELSEQAAAERAASTAGNRSHIARDTREPSLA